MLPSYLLKYIYTDNPAEIRLQRMHGMLADVSARTAASVARGRCYYSSSLGLHDSTSCNLARLQSQNCTIEKLVMCKVALTRQGRGRK